MFWILIDKIFVAQIFVASKIGGKISKLVMARFVWKFSIKLCLDFCENARFCKAICSFL